TAIAMPFTVPKVIGTVREAALARDRELRAARTDALEMQNARLTTLTDELSTVNAQLREALAVAEQERARADAANRVKGDFLRTMSHELRTPLNAIGGYVELLDLEIRGPVTEAQRNDLHRIRRAQLHLLGIITDILTYARIEAGALEYRSERVPLASVVEDVAGLIRPQLAAKGQELLMELEQPEDLLIRADATKLSQVLVNLLSNAHKYTPSGGRVILRAERHDDRVFVRVADTGSGIPRDRHEAVFEPFVQAVGGLARPFDGTGLGLAISRDMIRAMRGELVIVDQEARGELATRGFHGAMLLIDLPAFIAESSTGARHREQ
ncbi:MAG TPA: ATP-binding protein, partial [Gemmatimonas sp.]|nr:ATP-binding protein [Gemmatimonas sp.]